MISLEGTRTNANLKHALLEKGRCGKLWPNRRAPGEAAVFRALAAVSQAASGNRTGSGGVHPGYLIAHDDKAVSSAMSPSAAQMIADNSGMHAGMARTARDEGFDEIADWFETLAKAGRSRAGVCGVSCANARTRRDEPNPVFLKSRGAPHVPEAARVGLCPPPRWSGLRPVSSWTKKVKDSHNNHLILAAKIDRTAWDYGARNNRRQHA